MDQPHKILPFSSALNRSHIPALEQLFLDNYRAHEQYGKHVFALACPHCPLLLSHNDLGQLKHQVMRHLGAHHYNIEFDYSLFGTSEHLKKYPLGTALDFAVWSYSRMAALGDVVNTYGVLFWGACRHTAKLPMVDLNELNESERVCSLFLLPTCTSASPLLWFGATFVRFGWGRGALIAPRTLFSSLLLNALVSAFLLARLVQFFWFTDVWKRTYLPKELGGRLELSEAVAAAVSEGALFSPARFSKICDQKTLTMTLRGRTQTHQQRLFQSSCGRFSGPPWCTHSNPESCFLKPKR
jgi:hypothetical protein